MLSSVENTFNLENTEGKAMVLPRERPPGKYRVSLPGLLELRLVQDFVK